MRSLISLSLAFTVLMGLTAFAAPKSSASKKEYLTEDELDIIREAQDLRDRVPAYLDLAERRLIFLGLTTKSAQEQEKEKKDQELYEKQVKKAGTKGTPVPVKPPVDDLSYLKTFSRSDLLRGYIQVLDEVMDNIDGAYTNKLDVRGPIENLEKFTRETPPILEKFEAKNAAEKSALQDALSKAKEANDGAKDALKKVPKNEKRQAPSEGPGTPVPQRPVFGEGIPQTPPARIPPPAR